MSQLTVYFVIGAFLVGFGLGIFADNKLHLAAQAVQAHKEVAAAQAGEVKIIHDTQIITKVLHDTKDTCVNAPVPPAINNLLR